MEVEANHLRYTQRVTEKPPIQDTKEALRATLVDLTEASQQVANALALINSDRKEIRGLVEGFRVDLGAFRDNLRDAIERVGRIDKGLRGDEEGKAPGIFVRLDRIEQTVSGWVWERRTLYGAVLVILVKTFIDLVRS